MSEAQRPSDPAPAPSVEGLFCALAIAPTTFSRNRFPAMYEDPAARNARMRAHLVRNLVRQILRHPEHAVLNDTKEGVVVCIRVPHLNFRREAHLRGLEVSVLRYLLARAKGEHAENEREQIEAIMAKEWRS
jgi:hypothetical protein